MNGLARVGAAVALLAVMSVVGCGGEDVLTWVSSVDSGHSHSVTITEADISGEEPITEVTSSSGGHTHTVMLTAAEVTIINDGGQVTKTTSTDSGHSHTFVFEISSASKSTTGGY